MSLNKAIEHGKEKRKQYRQSRVFDVTCRNNGACGYCRGNRTHANKKRKFSADEQMKDHV